MENDTTHGLRALDVLDGDPERWSDFQYLAGVVQPTANAAHIPTTHWKKYIANLDVYREAEDQPYLSLLDLDRALVGLRNRGVQPSHIGASGPPTEADLRILDWVRECGYLGIVPTFARVIDAPGYPHRVTFQRIGGRWERFAQPETPAPAIYTCSWLDEWGFYRNRLQSWPMPPPKTDAIIRNLFDADLIHLRPFFPSWENGHNKNFLMPEPNSEAFFQLYAEPVSDIAFTANWFANCVATLSGWSPDDHLDKDKALEAWQAQRYLGELASTAAPYYAFNAAKNRHEEVRISPGLVASYAMMFLWDLLDDRRAIRCAVCNKWLVSNDKRHKYCSKVCRNTGQRRNYRQRAKLRGEDE